MKKWILLLAIGALLTSFLAAQSTGWDTWMNLNPQQRDAYQKLYQKFMNEINPMQSQLEAHYSQLRSQNFQAVPDHKAAIKIRRTIVTLEDTMQKRVLDYRLDALAILTKEQIVTLPSDCTLGFFLAPSGYGYGYFRRFGRGYGYGPGIGRGWGRGPGYGRGYFRGAGWGRGSYGRGYNLRSGWGGRYYYRRGFRRPFGGRYYWRRN
jgi:hypothetical protein